MSSTITETERLSVPKTSGCTSAVLPVEKRDGLLSCKRAQLSRTGSIEKLKKFNNYICSQHVYYLLPGLLLWLRTSQSNLTATMEKCIVYVRSMFLACTLRDRAQCKRAAVGHETKHDPFAAFLQETVLDLQPVLNALVLRLCDHLTAGYVHVRHCALVATVYCGACVIVLQLVGCAVLICSRIPPLGFVFLVLCVAYIAHIISLVMYQGEDVKEKQVTNAGTDSGTGHGVAGRKRLRKRLSLIGKTISNIKLF